MPANSIKVSSQGVGTRVENRSVPLDVLRGMAMLLVLFRHPVVPTSEAGVFTPIVRLLETIGWTGVDLFFVLSGFLIGGLLFKELQTSGRIEIRRFLIRRGLKIWPGYFALLAFASVQEMRHGFKSLGSVLYSLLPNLVHVQNYLGSIRGHTWTLAVEEHFYILLPLLLSLLILRRGKPLAVIPMVPIIAVLLAILCLSLRCRLSFTAPFSTITRVAPTHLRIDSLFWGVLLGYLREFRPELFARIAKRRIAVLTCALVLISPMFFFDLDTPFVHTVGFTMLYVGYGLMLMVFVNTSSGSGLLGNLIHSPIGRGMAFIGVYSYSIYLWHLDFAELILIERLNWIVHPSCPAEIRWTLGLVLYVGLATAAGVLMCKIIEQPVLELRNRIWPSKTVALPVIGGTP